MYCLNLAPRRGIAVALAFVLLTAVAGVVAALNHRQPEPVSLAIVEPIPQKSVEVVPDPAPQVAAQAPAPAAEPATEEVVVQHASIAQATISQAVTTSFDGRPLRHAGTMTMRVTAYSPDAQSCGEWADGFTASGYSVWTNGMKLVAADTSVLPMKSLLSIKGYHGGRPVQVLDRGGAIKGNRIDVLMPTHEQAMQWGVRTIEVDLWEYAD